MMKRPTPALLLAALLLPAAGLAAPQAQTTEPGKPASTQPLRTPPASFSDSQIERFADAYLKAAKIYVDYDDRIAQADDPDEAKRLRSEAERALREAVQQEDIDPATFNAIADRMQTDQALQQRIAQHLE